MVRVLLMEVTDKTLYVVETEDGDEVHNTRSDAVNSLTDSVGVGNVEDEEDSFEILEVEMGDEWSISPLNWRSVALEMMKNAEDE